MLQGDLNAHTRGLSDIIEDDEDMPSESVIVTSRNSEDCTKSDIRGEELTELCKSMNISILNGRKTAK